MIAFKNKTKFTLFTKQIFTCLCILLCLNVNSQQLDNPIKIGWQMNWDLRTMPAVGFFPLGGSTIDHSSLSTYFLGSGVDILGFENEGGSFSLLNLSAYLVGVNWLAIDPSEEAKIIQIAYFRLGPHYKFNSLNRNGAKSKLSFGGQIGLGALIEAVPTESRSRVQYGIDVSFTFSFY